MKNKNNLTAAIILFITFTLIQGETFAQPETTYTLYNKAKAELERCKRTRDSNAHYFEIMKSSNPADISRTLTFNEMEEILKASEKCLAGAKAAVAFFEKMLGQEGPQNIAIEKGEVHKFKKLTPEEEEVHEKRLRFRKISDELSELDERLELYSPQERKAGN